MASGARAGNACFAPDPDGRDGILIGALVAGLVALFIIASSDDEEDRIVSTKDVNGTGGKLLPGSPSVSRTQVVQDPWAKMAASRGSDDTAPDVGPQPLGAALVAAS